MKAGMKMETLIYIWQLKWIKMNGFEPTLLGIVTYVITISQLNEALQSLLIIATLVYTVIKIIQLLNDKKW